MVMDEPEFATVVATHDFDPGTLGLNRAKSRTLLIYKGRFVNGKNGTFLV